MAFGLPRAGDGPVTVTIPFKAPGSEPKSYPLRETVHLQQLPSLVGVKTEGEAVVPLNIAAMLAVIILVTVFFLLPLLRKFRLWQRLLIALGVGLAGFGVAALFGLNRVEAIIPPTKLNTAFIIAILAAVFMQVFLWRTKWGYELRAVGVAPEAAEYGGANIPRNTILAMTLSGAFAGLTACHYVLGGALEEYSLRQALPTNDGFDGIAVALLGANTPLGVVLSAFLFGVLKNGGTRLDVTFEGLTRDVVSMIVALVVLFIAAKGFLPESITNPLRRRLNIQESQYTQAKVAQKAKEA
jgi:simple sugar transport system permease protein